MPHPRKDETKEKFVDRCMGNPEANRSFPNQSQRFAFCQSRWSKEGGKNLPHKSNPKSK